MSATNYYCDPAWHDGVDVDADYLVRALTDTTDAFSRPSTWEDTETPWNETGMFAVCRTHLETAVHVMIARYDNVRVREIQR